MKSAAWASSGVAGVRAHDDCFADDTGQPTAEGALRGVCVCAIPATAFDPLLPAVAIRPQLERSLDS